MLSIHAEPTRLCDRITRRELLRVGGLSALGLSLPILFDARATAAPAADRTFGRAKSIIFLYLNGGPPQHETFDPKPEAPVEIRGAFQPIRTNVPGIHFCELLPRTARIADKLAVVRSLSTNNNDHDGSGYQVLTGTKYIGVNSRTIQPTDWPYFGSIVKMVRPSDVMPALSSVWIPDWTRLNENVTPAGQTGGFLGRQWDPDRFLGDPARPDYRIEGLRTDHLPPLQLEQRASLLQQVERHYAALERCEPVRAYDRHYRQALDLLTSGRARDAFALDKEPDRVRDRYGRSTWGQCLLLARRLVEAGARLVHVNWPREPGDNAVDNPLWDTHAQNADRLEDVLCPQFDCTFTALIEDLDQRGLLSETLVVAVGEFGRTPKINKNGGRDHWGPVFSFVLAGAGVAGGQVYGASDKQGAYPASDRVGPQDFTATLFHLLGISHLATFADREGRQHRITEGTPVYTLLGTAPATAQRVAPGGDVVRVPPPDGRLLLDTDFRTAVPLHAAEGPTRPRGWRATPLVTDDRFGVRMVERRVRLGFGGLALAIPKGATALLTQEVRSPFAGSFTLRVHARGTGKSREFYEQVFLQEFTCRLLFFQYTDPAKKPLERKELASVAIRPRFGDFEKFELTKLFVNPKPGDNFSFGLGLGVAVLLEKAAPDGVPYPSESAAVEIAQVRLEFAGKERDEDVRV